MAHTNNWGPVPEQPPSGGRRHAAPSAATRWMRRPSRGIVWVAVTALSLGLLAPFTFAYAAAKRTSVVTVATAVVFLALSLVMWLGPDEGWIFDAAIFGNLIGSICAALALRPYVFRASDRTHPHPDPTAPQPTGPQPPHPTWTPHPAANPEMTNAHLRQQTEQRRARRAEARTLATHNPASAVELGIGRPDRQTGYDDGGLIDLNRAPAGALSHLPGLGTQHIDALLRSRAELGPFVSLADAMIRADIPPHLEGEVAEYAVVF